MRSYRPVLVSVNVAMQVLGYDADSVVMMAESGRLRWVWDVSVHQAVKRELRFWMGELLNPTQPRNTGDVIQAVIGHETQPRLRAVTVGHTLLVRRPTIHALVHTGALTGPLVGGVQWIDRNSLEEFLRNRLLA